MKYLLIVIGVLSLTFSSFANTYYVKTTGNDTSNDGRSWGAAFSTLQKALEVCQYGDQIWVAEGTYKPTAYPKGAKPSGNLFFNRDKSFYLVNGVKLYGGFAGIEETVTERTPGHTTILSGDIGIENNDTDNCYHVVISVKDDSTTILDGFTITAGKADGINSSEPGVGITLEGKFIGNIYGGGILNMTTLLKINNCTFSFNSSGSLGGGMANMINSSPLLTNLTFTSNSSREGGGIHNYLDSAPMLTDVVFSDNLAKMLGGGMTNSSSSPILTNVTFTGNTAHTGGGMANLSSSPVLVSIRFFNNTSLYNGGGMANWYSSSPILTNVHFSRNVTKYDGGGMENLNSSPILKNVTFTENSAQSGKGGGICNWDKSSPTLTNVLFWLNSAGSGGGGIFNVDVSSPTLNHVTFAANSVVNSPYGRQGGAICNFIKSAPTINNGIFWDNMNKNPINGIIVEDDIFNRDNSTLSTTYTLMQLSNTAANYPPASFPTIDSGHNLFAQNPLFVDATSGNLRLRDCSPAINAGDTSGTVTYDLDGKLRPYPYGVAIGDMGAYENQSIAGGGPATLNVTDLITNGTVVKVAGEITATNQVSGATALYQATKSVTLLPDFSATGNGFTAFIGGCETLITSETPAAITK